VNPGPTSSGKSRWVLLRPPRNGVVIGQSPLQLPYQPMYSLPGGGYERALVPPCRKRSPEQKIGAMTVTNRPAGEIEEIADDLPGTEEGRLRFEPNESQTKASHGGSVGNQTGRRASATAQARAWTRRGPQLVGEVR